MRDFLLEIGVEDIPARFMPKLIESLENSARSILEDLRLEYESLQAIGTHRRLVLIVRGLREVQSDTVQEIRGPAVKVAFSQYGEPTKALLGFLKANNAQMDDIEIVETPKGKYVYLKRVLPGKQTDELIGQIVESIIKGLHTPESMRWIPGSNFRFIRPIRWLVCLYGSELIPVELANLKSGRHSRGHRFLSGSIGGGNVLIRSAETYLDDLQLEGVIVSPDERRKLIEEGIKSALAEGEMIRDHDLLEEWVFLAERPVVLATCFSSEYLELPPELIISVLKGQQKFMPVYKAEDGTLTSKFLVLKDGDDKHIDTAILGAKRVVHARLFDAKYFLEEDKRHSLESYVPKLSGILFHKDLGNMYDKSFRLQDLVKYILELLKVKEESLISSAIRAAYLCKADLVTHTVNEFPELQGIIGKYLALHSMEPEATAIAIAEHYMPRFKGDQLPRTMPGLALAIADRIDTAVGFISINVIPSATKDMYGIRRAIYQIIDMLIERRLRLNLNKLVVFTYKQFSSHFKLQLSEERVRDVICNIFKGRLEEVLADTFRRDLIRASADVAWKDMGLALEILHFLKEAYQTEEFVKVAKLGLRIRNILKGVKKTELEELEAWEFQETLMREPIEVELYKWLRDQAGEFKQNLKKLYIRSAYRQLLELADLVEKFFEDVFVMTDDLDLRLNRLKLLSQIREVINEFCDMSKVVTA